MQHLPPAILQNILELVSDDELCIIGLISRRLHDVAFEFLFNRRYNIGFNPELFVTIPPIYSWKASFFSIPRRRSTFTAIDHLICDYRPHYDYPLFSLEITLRPLVGLLEKLVTVKKLTLNLSDHFIQSDVRSSILALLRKLVVHTSCRKVLMKYNGEFFSYKRRRGFLSTLIPSHPSAWEIEHTHARRIPYEESCTKFRELPEEIIFLICQYLPTEDLYLLIQLPFINLKRWATSVYMRRTDKATSAMDSVRVCLLRKRRKIAFSWLDCVGNKELATSSILYMRKIACSASIQTIHHLYCQVQQNRPDAVFEFLYELYRLVLAVPTIHKFTFDFLCDTSQWGASLLIKRALSSVIWTIFDAVSRSSCTSSSYVVKGSICNTHVFLPARYLRNSEIPSRISTLTLDCETFDNHTLPRWVVLPFKTTQITHLDVRHLSLGFRKFLGSMSGSLAYLTELHLAGDHLLPAFISILCKTSRLVSLSLREFDIKSQKLRLRPIRSMPDLPHLRNLSAPYAYIRLWKNSSALPSLERLALFLGSWSELARASPRRLKALTRLVQRLSAGSAFSHFSLEISLQATESMLTEEEPYNFDKRPQMSDLLSWVKEITLSNCNSRRLPPTMRSAFHMCAVTARCMMMFPAVRIYAFKGMENERVSQALKGIGLNSLFVEMPAYAQVLLATMCSSQVPLISTVIVDGVVLTDDEVINLYFN